MKGDEPGLVVDGRVERGDVGVADDRFRILFQRVVVELFDEAHRAVSAACAPDAVNLRVANCVVEIFEAVRVFAGEVAEMLFAGVLSGDRFPSERARVVGGALELFSCSGAGGRNQRNARILF